MAADPQSPTQINAVSVETRRGFRTFELYSGDMLSHESDLLVISTHHNLAQPATGKLVSSLRKRFGLRVDVSQPWISFGDGTTACQQAVPEGLPFKHLLTMRIARPGNQTEPTAFYDRAVQNSFAAIAAMEFLGHGFGTVSLPVLAGQRIVNYDASVDSLLRFACHWLRQSVHTEVVRYYVYEPDQLRAWDEAMNRTLGRSYVDAAGQIVLEGLCKEITQRIDAAVAPEISANVSLPLRQALSNPHQLVVQTIATFGRKLAETVAEELCRDLQLPVHRELINNIEQVRRTKAVADWIPSYLHSLRVFGNEAVHALADKAGRIPTQLSEEDLLSILSAIRAVLSFWIDWRQRQGDD